MNNKQTMNPSNDPPQKAAEEWMGKVKKKEEYYANEQNIIDLNKIASHKSHQIQTPSWIETANRIKASYAEKQNFSVLATIEELSSSSSDKPCLTQTPRQATRDAPIIHSRFATDYRLPHLVHNGENSKIFHVIHRVDGQKYVIKKLKFREYEVEVAQFSEEENKKITRLLEISSDQMLQESELFVRYHSAWVEVDKHTAYIYFQMEKCEKSLKDFLLQDRGTMNESVFRSLAVSFMHDICKAVEKLHEKNMMHRYINLQHCLIARNGSAKLGGFDHSRILPPNDKRKLSPQNHPSSSPEMRRKKVSELGEFTFEYDQKTDIFALGLVIFELFCSVKT